ncbi:MAG TPA: DNA topoisomerase IB [Candidatus Dormibacteraeota bacterium]|nr:DNA topoisomerase IB [Candidatus Dormibacteraeota bacterium]
MPRRAQPAPTDPEESARAARLRYVNDGSPGIGREPREGGGFRYIGPDGRTVRRAAELQRIAHLAVPPAWTDVWICPAPNGHIQATGRDARGRKQYRYHERWREVRDATKYERTVAFGEALPRIRARIDSDLRRPDVGRERVLATIVRLLDTTYIRVGNEEYARENRSFGLTTMHSRHVEVDGSRLRFQFRGKSGKLHTVGITDRRVARVITRLQDLPGQQAFQWQDGDGSVHGVESDDVNGYIREAAGEDFTAKDFRTWAGTVLACAMLHELDPPETQTQAKKNVVEAIKRVANRLGNTPSVCRKCYVHPAVLESYMGGAMVEAAKKEVTHEVEKELEKDLHALREEEKDLVKMLEQKLAKAA